MLTNADITIFNQKRVDRSAKYLKTVIRNVSWHSEKKNTGGDVADASDIVAIRIPIDADFGEKTYVPVREFEKMSMEDAEKHWTLGERDIVVKGVVEEDEVTQAFLVEKYGDVHLVNDFSDNTDIGSDRAKHWRVGGS